MFPLHRVREISDLDEEKRLLYVALTRAKEKLFLTYCQKRNGKDVRISPFINLLDSNNFDLAKDEMVDKIIKRQQRFKLKKSQLSFF